MNSNFTINDAKKWILSFNSSSSSSSSSSLPFQAILLCFHWAGGNGQYFKLWSKYFSNYNIGVKAIMLPGRMGRSKESFITNISEISGLFSSQNIFSSSFLREF